MTTAERTLVAGTPGPGGYRQLHPGAGETHLTRDELRPGSTFARGSSTESLQAAESLLTIAHLSDLHVCDAQSPARAEFLDRLVDPDSALLELIEEVGTYRAQELLTVQVAEAMVRAVNAVAAGPVGGRPVELAITTGDVIDNAQANELDWYLALLDGGELVPDSGDRGRWEGVADQDVFDERFWHPDGDGLDLARATRGFPGAPGLLDAIRAPFRAGGLAMPWLAVHGNHDQLLQGTVTGTGFAAAAAVGGRKPIAIPEHWTTADLLALLGGLQRCEPAALRRLAQARMRPVTADPARRIITRQEYIDAHFAATARPAGHGFGAANTSTGRAYYRHDHEQITFLVLDTVDEFGFWQGSLDLEQFGWLRKELAAADREQRYVVLASHHPLHTLVNDTRGPDGARRVLAEEFDALVCAHRCVVLWLNGHTHATAVHPHGSYWEVTAPSLIDWPQQSRLVEVLRTGSGELVIATTMVDHLGSAPWNGHEAPWAGRSASIESMAGLSRELSANAWQSQRASLTNHQAAGDAGSRNALLVLADPWTS